LLDHRRLVQRDLSAIGRADEEVLERVHRATIGLRKLHHHPELVAPSRLAKRLGSVERVTDLRAKIARRDAKAPPFRGDLEVELGHGPTEALADVLDARVEGERIGEVRRSVPQRLDVRVSKLDVDLGRAARADEVVEEERLEIGDLADVLSPGVREHLARELALALRDEDDAHLGLVRGILRDRREETDVDLSSGADLLERPLRGFLDLERDLANARDRRSRR